jgi:hypothetical protein
VFTGRVPRHAKILSHAHTSLFLGALKSDYISEVTVTISWSGKRVAVVSLMVTCSINTNLHSPEFLRCVAVVVLQIQTQSNGSQCSDHSPT